MNLTSLIIGLLTLVLVLNCALIILLVLVQLPKKEAGLGMAFGGSAADALFGAGSGTVVSRWTKYATGLFLGLSLLLSVMRNHEARAAGRNILRELERQPAAAAPATTGPAGAAPAVTPVAPATQPTLQLTNLPAAPAASPDTESGTVPTPNPGP